LPHSSIQDDEITDPEFGDASEIRRKAKSQALIIKHFNNRWRTEYLTALREAHRKTGDNAQQVKISDIVLVHDDTARVNWKLAVIESLNKGADDMIRSVNIRTASGRTNRPIARLYPLEVNSPDMAMTAPETDSETDSETRNSVTTSANRPTREAAKRGQQKIREWVNLLRAPPEDVLKI